MVSKAKRSEDDYYDIEIELEDPKYLDIDSIFYLKDLKQRKLFLEDDVNQCTVSDISKHIMQFNTEDKGKPVEERQRIILYISSNGGDADIGMALANIIEQSETPIITVCEKAYSMAFLILMAGKVRYAFPDSRLLLHDGSGCVYDSTGKMKDYLEFSNVTEQRTKEYVMKHSKITSEYYDAVYRQELWMLADRAKELGVIDKIIGVDCNLDEII